MIAQSPCRRVSLPKIEREEMRFLTPVEIARLADAIRPHYRALVLVGAYGGLRIGEEAAAPVRPRQAATGLPAATRREVERCDLTLCEYRARSRNRMSLQHGR
jgi:hypothetical protein